MSDAPEHMEILCHLLHCDIFIEKIMPIPYIFFLNNHPSSMQIGRMSKKKARYLSERAKSNLFTELEETGKLYRNAAYAPNLLSKY